METNFEKVEEGPEFCAAIKERDTMRPGITGLWQVSGRSDLGFREMVLLDLYYIENQSFLLDLEILFETIPVILFGKGAYQTRIQCSITCESLRTKFLSNIIEQYDRPRPDRFLT